MSYRDGVRGAMPSTQPSGVVGRESELAAIAAFMDGAGDGLAALVIEGDPGIGKTILWRQGVALARERLYWALASREAEAEAKLGFAALGDLLEPVLEQTLPDLPTPQRAALETALLRSEDPAASVDARAVSVAVLNVVRSLARVSPVVLAVDDLPWLDAPSARVLAFVLRRLDREPVLFLATRRGAQPAPFDLEDIVPNRLQKVALGPLAQPELRCLLETHAAGGATRSALRRVERASAGNPFFALQLLHLLAGQQEEPVLGEPPALPDDVLGAARGRLALLTAADRRMLLAAAAASQPTVELITAAAKTAHAAESAIARAIRAGVVERDGERLRFVHPLFASALYGDVSAAERRRLHRRLATVVGDVEERAKHLALAADAPDAETANALAGAASRAASRGAPEEAADLAETAVRLTPPARRDERLRRLVAAADNALVAGDVARARRLLEAAVPQMSPGAERAKALCTLATAVAAADAVWAPLELLEQACRESGDDDAVRASVEVELTRFWVHSHDLQRASVHAYQALELAERGTDPYSLANALAMVTHVDFLRGLGVDHEKIGRALALHDSTVAPGLATHPGMLIAPVLEGALELEGARSLLVELERLGAEMGDEMRLPFVFTIRGAVELAAGDHETASRYVDEGLALATRTGQRPVKAMLLTVRTAIDALRGRAERVRADAEEGRALTAEAGTASHLADSFAVALGFLELSLGNAATALEHVAALEASVVANGIVEPVFYSFVPDQVEALVALGRLDEASAVLGRQQRRADGVARPWASATNARCQGLIAAARGDFGQALEALERALVEHERLPVPFEQARTLMVKGTVERRAKQKRAARASLEEAAEIFEQLGAPLWTEKARAELARIGGRAPTGGELSATEARVAELVATGCSNYEVARALFLSPKTVEWNLTKIYRKLHVHSRSELAAKLAKRSVRTP